MSDNLLRFIPKDPEYVPDEAAQDRGLASLRRLVPEADDVYKWTEAKKIFVDQGANFESLRCPLCRTELDIEWWNQAMEKAYEGDGFGVLAIQTPCCHSLSSLNELDYHFQAGFARFGLETRNPNINEQQAKDIVPELEQVLNCALKYIWAHY